MRALQRALTRAKLHRKPIAIIPTYSSGRKSPWGTETWPWLRRISSEGTRRARPRPRAPERRGADRRHRRGRDRLRRRRGAQLGPARRRGRARRPSGSCSPARCTNHGERMLRELESVANSEAAYRKIRVNFDPEWVQVYVGLRLQSFSITISSSWPIRPTASSTPRSAAAASIRTGSIPSAPISMPILDHAARPRRRNPTGNRACRRRTAPAHPAQQPARHRLQTFLGRPAIVAAVAIASAGETSRRRERQRRRS